MYAVINHLHFRDPMTTATVQALRGAVHKVVDAGALAARVIQVEDTHAILQLDFSTPEDADRVSREIGGPWMRENIVPLLANGTDRSAGQVIAAAPA